MGHLRIIALHKKVSKRIKEYETYLNEFPPIAVLNEMRYAFRAIIEYLEIQDKGSDPENSADLALQKANHALLCAYHDLVDGLAITLTSALEELRVNYLEETIAVLGSKRLEIIDCLQEVNEKIIESRHELGKRQEIYDEELYDKYFNDLLSHRKLLRGSAWESVIELSRNKKKRHRNLAIVATLGIIVSLAGVAASL